MKYFYLFILLFLLGACTSKTDRQSYIKVDANGQFIRNGGAILASEGEGGDRERLHKELDFMKSIGIDNLRVLVGVDGENPIRNRILPALQKEPGIYNDTILSGLDYLMNELRRRDMTAVLFLNNSWDWSG